MIENLFYITGDSPSYIILQECSIVSRRKHIVCPIIIKEQLHEKTCFLHVQKKEADQLRSSVQLISALYWLHRLYNPSSSLKPGISNL